MTTKSFIAIGDIHGCFDQLATLLSLSYLFQSRIPVFLGDYVDVGSKSSQVIELLLEAKMRLNTAVFLSGNHDYEMLRYMADGNFVRYAKLGGTSTISSYCDTRSGDLLDNFRKSVPKRHIYFLRELGICYETDQYLFSHCGYNPSKPDDRSLESMVLGSHSEIFDSNVLPHKTVICGHYFQQALTPLVRDKLICIDTGCGLLKGPLTALLLPELQYIQVSSDLSVAELEIRDSKMK